MREQALEEVDCPIEPERIPKVLEQTGCQMIGDDRRDLDLWVGSKLPSCETRSSSVRGKTRKASTGDDTLTLEEQRLCSLQEAHLALETCYGVQFPESAAPDGVKVSSSLSVFISDTGRLTQRDGSSSHPHSGLHAAVQRRRSLARWLPSPRVWTHRIEEQQGGQLERERPDASPSKQRLTALREDQSHKLAFIGFPAYQPRALKNRASRWDEVGAHHLLLLGS
jgi:hypothetical protein